MSCISWNCRGLGNPRACQFLKDIVVQKKPNFIFLCETLCKKDVIERLRVQLSFGGSFCVEAQEILIQNTIPWRLTGIYGEPKRSLRFNTWKLIHDLAIFSQLPWCLIGDLNNIGSPSEKKGGRPYPSSLIAGFQEVLQSCDLIDLDLRGYPFTWERSKGTPSSVEIRLDKALVSHLWLQSFPQATLTNGDFSSSDHIPIFLEPKPPWLPKKIYHFRYENCWSREPFCSQLVDDCWKNNNHLSLAERIKACGIALDSWGRTLTGNFKTRISKSKQKLSRLKSSTDATDVQNFITEQTNYFEILAQQELYWKQRSKQHWLHGGDKNSKYFHAYAITRKCNNQIHVLQDSRGVLKDWDSGLETVISNYFSDLYTANASQYLSVVNGVNCSVDIAQNNDLLQLIQDEEVKHALF
ncbi:uncharacterized protein LOC133038223 [Cannabis sativa]|uniref:uncharacterized protein LOC133038223 n=1 Tax=Cannabis sativa TaxID=3483 RepID=UPI0029C9D9F2|nr:uncharacterized protein LOC133038223 [Cannabis sativa]